MYSFCYTYWQGNAFYSPELVIYVISCKKLNVTISEKNLSAKPECFSALITKKKLTKFCIRRSESP